MESLCVTYVPAKLLYTYFKKIYEWTYGHCHLATNIPNASFYSFVCESLENTYLCLSRKF